MADIIVHSRATYAGGIKGFAYGALGGALSAALLGALLILIGAGEGGFGLVVAAGAAFGGMVGLMLGAIHGSATRRTGEPIRLRGWRRPIRLSRRRRA